MNNEQNNLLLDEPLVTRKIYGWLIGLAAASAIAGGISGAGKIDMMVVGIVLAMVAFVALIVWLEHLLLFRRMRIRMDVDRVWTHIPLQKDRSLEWKQLRTAAIVTLKNMNYPTQIVLSVHEPREALTRKRMMWKNAKRGEEMRFPMTESRRAVIEGILGMTLPEIEL